MDREQESQKWFDSFIRKCSYFARMFGERPTGAADAVSERQLELG